jgi:uncharacterized membrane protein
MENEFHITNITSTTYVNLLEIWQQFSSSLVSKNIRNKEIQNKIKQHPNFPSLLSLTDNLSVWNVQNITIKLENEEKKGVYDLPCPFLADTTNGYIIVEDIADDTIVFSDLQNRTQKKSVDQFLANWSGIAILALPNEHSGEDNYTLNRFFYFLDESKVFFAVFLGVFVLAFLAYNTIYLSVFVLFCLKIIGVVVSSLLIAHELDGTDSVVNKVCTGIKSDCNKVLKSEQAKLFGFISWADLGVVYFAGSAAALLFCWNDTSSLLYFLKIINITSLLFIPYSLWYQYRIAKEWCYFCLAILVLFGLEYFVLNFVTNSGFVAPFLPSLIALLIAFGSVIIVLLYLKPLLVENASSRSRITNLQTTKYQPELFQAALNAGRFLPKTPNKLAFRYGEPDAINTITLITNPYCGFCSNAHTMIEEYLNGCFDNLAIEIMITPSEDKQSDSYKIAYTLAETYQNDPKKALILMHEWYSATDKGEAWLKTCLLPITNETTKHLLEEQRLWLDAQKINYTPFVAFNNQEIDAKYGYTIRDLRYFFE